MPSEIAIPSSWHWVEERDLVKLGCHHFLTVVGLCSTQRRSVARRHLSDTELTWLKWKLGTKIPTDILFIQAVISEQMLIVVLQQPGPCFLVPRETVTTQWQLLYPVGARGLFGERNICLLTPSKASTSIMELLEPSLGLLTQRKALPVSPPILHQEAPAHHPLHIPDAQHWPFSFCDIFKAAQASLTVLLALRLPSMCFMAYMWYPAWHWGCSTSATAYRIGPNQ